MLLFGTDDSSVGLFSLKSKEVELELREHDSAYQVRSVSFNLTDTLIASGSSDGELIVK